MRSPIGYAFLVRASDFMLHSQTSTIGARQPQAFLDPKFLAGTFPHTAASPASGEALRASLVAAPGGSMSTHHSIHFGSANLAYQAQRGAYLAGVKIMNTSLSFA